MANLRNLGLKQLLELLDIENADLELIAKIHQLREDPIVARVDCHKNNGGGLIWDYNVYTQKELTPKQARNLFERHSFPEPGFIEPGEGCYRSLKSFCKANGKVMHLLFGFELAPTRLYRIWLYKSTTPQP